MFLLILESIGTSELIMVAIIALIFLGPRKLPEIARKAGKIMADLRNTTNDFKSTWEREVNFEAEAKALRTGDVEAKPVDRTASPEDGISGNLKAPSIKSVDTKQFEQSIPKEASIRDIPVDGGESSEKRNWF